LLLRLAGGFGSALGVVFLGRALRRQRPAACLRLCFGLALDLVAGFRGGGWLLRKLARNLGGTGLAQRRDDLVPVRAVGARQPVAHHLDETAPTFELRRGLHLCCRLGPGRQSRLAGLLDDHRPTVRVLELRDDDVVVGLLCPVEPVPHRRKRACGGRLVAARHLRSGTLCDLSTLTANEDVGEALRCRARQILGALA
jgi:hypothetical protein